MASTRKAPEPRISDRVLDGLRWRIGRIGVKVTALITINGGAPLVAPFPVDESFEFCQLREQDIDALLQLEPHYTRARLLEWFRAGKLCFALRAGSRVVSKTWCDVDEVNDDAVRRKLAPREAYLFAAFTDPDFRGINLAPILRTKCCNALRQRGFDRFVALCDYFNLPARRYHQKLGAIEEDLNIEIRIFDKWSRTFTFTINT